MFISEHDLQVWQYYLLPEEEQHMAGVKNPMCNTFPRVGKLNPIEILIRCFLLSDHADHMVDLVLLFKFSEKFMCTKICSLKFPLNICL